jgi:copper chaperone NosL
MKSRFMFSVLTMTMTLTLTLSSSDAADRAPAKPGLKDKCPVCGMFVAKYPDWTAQIVFKNGSRVFFDGVKDMFKYYFNVVKYEPGRNREDIDSIFVLDYYRIETIDGRNACYVQGSEIYGPMGRELIPFEKESDAAEFLKDHKGKSVVKFRQITPEVIKALD